MRISLLLCLAACGPPAGPAGTTTLTVLAASSLTDAFGDLEREFEQAHPELQVVLSFAGSQTLTTQVRNGLQADVVATASTSHLQGLAAEGLVQQPRAFASNRLVLVVSEQAPAHIDLEHLGEVHRIVLGAPEVPVGGYTHRMLGAAQSVYGDAWRAQVDAHVVSREPSVRLVLAKVALGEADAAVVYATDAAHSTRVRTVDIPSELSFPTTDLHALLLHANPAAQQWLDFVESPDGQTVLRRHGFGPPK